MPILKLISAPNGAQVGYHRIAQVEGTFPNLVVAVHGWPDEQACKDMKPPLYVHRISFDGTDLMDELETHALQAYVGEGETAFQPFAGGAIISDNASELEALKTRRWAYLKAHRDKLMYAPIPYQDYAVDADMDSQIKILGSAFMMQATPGATKMWRCSDNVMREFGIAELLAIGSAISVRTQDLIDTTAVLWQQMADAETPEEVANIHWPDAPLPNDDPNES